MKLKVIVIEHGELQDYLDKYQDKIKFIFPNCTNAWKTTLVIDEA